MRTHGEHLLFLLAQREDVRQAFLPDAQMRPPRCLEGRSDGESAGVRDLHDDAVEGRQLVLADNRLHAGVGGIMVELGRLV